MGRYANLDSLALWQTYPWLLTSNYEHVGFSRSKRVLDSIFNVHNVEASVMAFTMSDHTHSTHIATTSDHRNDTGIEADEICDLASRQVNLDSIVDLNGWIGITDSASCLYQFLFAELYQSLVQRLKDGSKLTFVHHA